jgi:hypothetical protein
MLRNRRERGEGQLGCLVGLIILALAVFVAWKMVPIKVKAAEVRGVVVDEAKSAGTHNDKVIMGNILSKAHEDNLPLTEENVKISRGGGNITIDVNYVVPVEFPGYTYQWHFNHTATNPIF